MPSKAEDIEILMFTEVLFVVVSYLILSFLYKKIGVELSVFIALFLIYLKSKYYENLIESAFKTGRHIGLKER